VREVEMVEAVLEASVAEWEFERLGEPIRRRALMVPLLWAGEWVRELELEEGWQATTPWHL
jgi:hypothetical protein